MSAGDTGGHTRGGVRGRLGRAGTSTEVVSSGDDQGTTTGDRPSSFAYAIVASEGNCYSG
jgi:hypothetical protein